MTRDAALPFGSKDMVGGNAPLLDPLVDRLGGDSASLCQSALAAITEGVEYEVDRALRGGMRRGEIHGHERKALLYDSSSIAELSGEPSAGKIKHCFMTDADILAEKLRTALKKSGITQADLARRIAAAMSIDVSPQDVHSWLKTGRISKPKLAAFARETNSDVAHLLGEPSPNYGAQQKSRDVPIIGFAIATPEGEGFFDDMGYPPGAAMEYVLTWHSDDPNAYGLRVRRDSMSPRIRAGEIIVIEPSAAVSSGDDVLVKMRNGRKMVKRLLYQRAGEVGLHSINQAHGELTISVQEIEEMHLVAAILPRSTKTKEGST